MTHQALGSFVHFFSFLNFPRERVPQGTIWLMPYCSRPLLGKGYQEVSHLEEWDDLQRHFEENNSDLPSIASPMCHKEKQSVLGKNIASCDTVPTERGWERMPMGWSRTALPSLWTAFSWSQHSALGPWEMLHFNQLRGVLSVLKATQNWEVSILVPVLMPHRVTQTNPT